MPKFKEVIGIVFVKPQNMYLNKILFIVSFAVFGLHAQAIQAFSQTPLETADFKTVVENKLKNFQNVTLEKICPIETDATARRIFGEYGAIFVSNKTFLPTSCIFTSEQSVQDFQTKAAPQTESIGGVNITLQKPAMDALLRAQQEAKLKRLRITPRGGSLAARRSFDDTIGLWNSRFYPALAYWTRRGKIPAQEAAAVKTFPIREQIAKVLEYESRGWFFSKDLSKSILYSVAAPGASQHNFMLALDVEQFGNRAVREILARHGWFQTVKSDLPHFTYLGVNESDLPALGLKSVTVGSQRFWIPNLEP